MAKNIIDVVAEKQKQLKANPVLAAQNMSLAMAAMRDGIKSDAWQVYMTQFVEQSPPGKPIDPDQLARLTAKDGTLGDPILDRQRAYLVANAICGPSTVDTMDFGVDTIDHTLENAGDVARAFLEDPFCPTTVTGVADVKAARKGGKKAAKKAGKRYNS